tara:strand:- start:26 stop:361 length:336 start_codon:yes stop_codon:yes gene_type:complete
MLCAAVEPSALARAWLLRDAKECADHAADLTWSSLLKRPRGGLTWSLLLRRPRGARGRLIWSSLLRKPSAGPGRVVVLPGISDAPEGTVVYDEKLAESNREASGGLHSGRS